MIGTEALIEAVPSPAWSRIGTATQRRPGVYSWSSTAKPRRRMAASSGSSVAGSVIV
jgi:hypothetical protein